MSIKVKLLRPLDGQEVGSIVEYSQADATRLASRGAVQIITGKAAPEPMNKKAPEVANKADVSVSRKKGS